MEQTHDTSWEQAVARLARQFEYPATPAIRPLTADRRPRTTASSGRPSAAGRRLAWALLIIALLAGSLIAAPRTRAALLSLFTRIGAIEIFIDETAPTPTAQPPTTEPPEAVPPLSATLSPRPTTAPAAHSLELFELGEATTLETARRLADFPLSLPGALDEPQEVYLHHGVDLPAVTFVWRDEADEPLSLTEIGVAEFITKLARGDGVRATRVGDEAAIWIEGPHRLQLLDGWPDSELLITSNVLIWADEAVTYRLEGELGEAEMIAIAESLPTSPLD
jgi:hypothetical protein